MQTWFDHFGNDDNPCLVIGEIAQTHDGSLGTAHAYIDAIANAGADAVKFQTHIAAAESTPGEPWRVKFSRQDATRFDYWKRMEFTEAQWHGLAEHAAERGLIFLSSAFSFEAVDLLERVGVPAWKVGAGETSNLPLLEKMARTGKPVILSSGMSDWAELDAAVNCVREHGAPVAVLLEHAHLGLGDRVHRRRQQRDVQADPPRQTRGDVRIRGHEVAPRRQQQHVVEGDRVVQDLRPARRLSALRERRPANRGRHR